MNGYRRVTTMLGRRLKANGMQPYGSLQNREVKKVVTLKRSKNYMQLKDQKKVLDQQVAAYRKTIHGNIANEVCALGTILKFEDISYKAIQKRYGKCIGKAAPASRRIP